MNHIVLYQPEIPGNTGNIMRTCAGTNTKLHLIKPLGFSLSDRYIKRSGVNYIEHCDYTVYENWEDFLSKNEGEFYFFTRYGKKAPSEFSYTDTEKDIYLVFGKESTGIPKSILREHLDRLSRLPMTDHIRALNLSNTAAIVIYEVLRQQNYPGLFRTEPFKGEDWILEDEKKIVKNEER